MVWPRTTPGDTIVYTNPDNPHDRRGALQEVSVVDQKRWDRAVGSMFCGRYLHLIAAASAGQVAPLREMLQWLEAGVLGVDMRLRLARERPRAWARRV